MFLNRICLSNFVEKFDALYELYYYYISIGVVKVKEAVFIYGNVNKKCRKFKFKLNAFGSLIQSSHLVREYKEIYNNLMENGYVLMLKSYEPFVERGAWGYSERFVIPFEQGEALTYNVDNIEDMSLNDRVCMFVKFYQ